LTSKKRCSTIKPHPLQRGLRMEVKEMKIKVTDKANEEIQKSMSQKTSDVRILVKGFG